MKPSRIGLVLGLIAAVGLIGWGSFYVYGRVERGRTLVLATTTSTYDTGLLDVLVPPFEKAQSCKVQIIAVGTGQALELGRRGDADVLLVHAPKAELAFMAEGHGLSRHPVMYNDFVIVGPASDPLKLTGLSLADALRRLAGAGARGKALFLSRGDNSGTDMKEKGFWAKLNIKPASPWYQEVGAGMGDTLRMTAERGAYTLSDRGTYLARYGPGSNGQGQLSIVVQGDPDLYNPYAVIVIDPKVHPKVNEPLASKFSAYLLSDQARQIISTFGVDKYGQQLFWVLTQ